MTAFVPAHAVVDAPKEQDGMVQNAISIVKKNKTVIATLVTAALVAAAYRYVTGVAVPAPIGIDCAAIANAHCAGVSVPWPLLEQCQLRWRLPFL